MTNVDYLTPNEQVHFQIEVAADNEFVTAVKADSEVKKVAKSHSVDFGKGILNLYKGLPGFNVLFPIPFTNSYLVVGFNEKTEIDKVNILKMEAKGSQLEISFTNTKTDVEVKGIYQDGEYVRAELVNSPDGITIQNSFMRCVEEGFNRLPHAMKVFCGASCAAIWTLVGSAACAGCIAGAGITC